MKYKTRIDKQMPMKSDSRSTVIQNAFNAIEELDLQKPPYREAVVALFSRMLNEDLGQGDVSLTPQETYKTNLKAQIIAKSPSIIAGLEETVFFLDTQNIKCTSKYNSGDAISNIDTLLNVEGKATQILSLERTILNILQRLCGIASMTHSYVDQISGTSAFITATRKTLWGLPDKRAVQCGGGLTHRLGLHDAAILKENHLAILHQSKNQNLFKQAISDIIATYPYLKFIEIEVTNAEEFMRTLTYLRKITAPFPFVIMFDHFTPDQIPELISKTKQIHLYNNILFEASGDISLENVRDYAETGVDVISVGALTHSVTSADLSLLIDNKS
jgi:nicotinate-nucleotide pyrophosphorylase (carboxylating)